MLAHNKEKFILKDDLFTYTITRHKSRRLVTICTVVRKVIDFTVKSVVLNVQWAFVRYRALTFFKTLQIQIISMSRLD